MSNWEEIGKQRLFEVPNFSINFNKKTYIKFEFIYKKLNIFQLKL